MEHKPADYFFHQEYSIDFFSDKLESAVYNLYIEYYYKMEEYDKSIGGLFDKEKGEYCLINGIQKGMSNAFNNKLRIEIYKEMIRACDSDDDFKRLEIIKAKVKKQVSGFSYQGLRREYNRVKEVCKND
jgi:hypothetical protein